MRDEEKGDSLAFGVVTFCRMVCHHSTPIAFLRLRCVSTFFLFLQWCWFELRTLHMDLKHMLSLSSLAFSLEQISVCFLNRFEPEAQKVKASCLGWCRVVATGLR